MKLWNFRNNIISILFRVSDDVKDPELGLWATQSSFKNTGLQQVISISSDYCFTFSEFAVDLRHPDSWLDNGLRESHCREQSSSVRVSQWKQLDTRLTGHTLKLVEPILMTVERVWWWFIRRTMTPWTRRHGRCTWREMTKMNKKWVW